jgi:hypothetical protein
LEFCTFNFTGIIKTVQNYLSSQTNKISHSKKAMAKSLTFTEAVDRVQEWRRRWDNQQHLRGIEADEGEGCGGEIEEDDEESGRVAVTRL